jgi:hypothetical protein
MSATKIAKAGTIQVKYDNNVDDPQVRAVIYNNVGFHVGHLYVLNNSSSFTIDHFNKSTHMAVNAQGEKLNLADLYIQTRRNYDGEEWDKYVTQFQKPADPYKSVK